MTVSSKTVELIQSLLVLDPKKRLTASQALEKARNIIAAEQSLMFDTDLQVMDYLSAEAVALQLVIDEHC